MTILIVSLLVLFAGYHLMGRAAERIFQADNAQKTPVTRMADGIDYVAMPKWKMFLIELLNIAGLGPIFGAISGALFGPAAFLWIVLGSLLIGGMHDYFSGMISLRHDGATFAEVTGRYLGKKVLGVTRVFTLILLTLLGVVFIKGPAGLLANLTQGSAFGLTFWLTVIFLYCVAATFFPIDKVIGKIYPLFGVLFILMALALLVMLLVFNKAAAIPAFTLDNLHYDAKASLWPMLFITIACGAVSGFHATQTPLMARCLQRETPDGRQIFYGAMLTESVIALAWAGASMSFFDSMGGFAQVMQDNGNNPAIVVSMIANTWFGKVGGVLAILGVVAAPVTSAGSSFRVARLAIADIFKLEQKSIQKRLVISIPLFIAAFILLQVDFAIIWRYFAFSNQTLAMITLWTCAVYIAGTKKAPFSFMLALPAAFMTAVVVSYILCAPEGFKLPLNTATAAGIAAAGLCLALFMKKGFKKPLADNLHH